MSSEEPGKDAAGRMRLLAAWAAAEGYLGGILHALKLPVTGLLIGSAAVTVLTRLAHLPGRRAGDLLRATGVVAVVKALLSPHAPAMAYVAVGFQGLAAEGLFAGSGARPHRARAVALGALALAESAAQKLLVLTIWLGKGFWIAVDEFLLDLTHRLGVGPGVDAGRLAVAYVVGHTLVGAVVGWRAGREGATAPARNREAADRGAATDPASARVPGAGVEPVHSSVTAPAGTKRSGVRANWLLALLGAGLLALLAWSPGWLPRHPAVALTLRAVGLLALWTGGVAPLLARALRRWLLGQGHRRWAADVAAVLTLLPEARAALVAQWRHRFGASR